jgi:hypothetical protein
VTSIASNYISILICINFQIDGKFDAELSEEARQWIEAAIDESISPLWDSADAVHECLKDGKILLKLINVIRGKSIKINSQSMAFKQMENINNFLKECEAMDMVKTDLFQTADLYDNKNIPQVINSLYALGRKCQTLGIELPIPFGTKESTENKRQFSEQQLKEGQHIIGLQAGSNKGASQAGMSFGSTRQIK